MSGQQGLSKEQFQQQEQRRQGEFFKLQTEATNVAGAQLQTDRPKGDYSSLSQGQLMYLYERQKQREPPRGDLPGRAENLQGEEQQYESAPSGLNLPESIAQPAQQQGKQQGFQQRQQQGLQQGQQQGQQEQGGQLKPGESYYSQGQQQRLREREQAAVPSTYQAQTPNVEGGTQSQQESRREPLQPALTQKGQLEGPRVGGHPQEARSRGIIAPLEQGETRSFGGGQQPSDQGGPDLSSARAEIVELIRVHPAVVFSDMKDDRCQKAKRIMAGTGGLYFSEELDVREDEGILLRQALFDMTKRRNLPVIYINGKCIGGLDDLEKLQKRKELEPLLREAGSLTGWSKERAQLAATLDDTGTKFAAIARTY